MSSWVHHRVLASLYTRRFLDITNHANLIMCDERRDKLCTPYGVHREWILSVCAEIGDAGAPQNIATSTAAATVIGLGPRRCARCMQVRVEAYRGKRGSKPWFRKRRSLKAPTVITNGTVLTEYAGASLHHIPSRRRHSCRHVGGHPRRYNVVRRRIVTAVSTC